MNKQTQETIFVSTFAQLKGHLMPSKKKKLQPLYVS
jgi:hypothetical protein